MNHSQKNWIKLLSITQLTLNNRIVTMTKELVFYMNFGQHSNLFNILRELSQAETAL